MLDAIGEVLTGILESPVVTGGLIALGVGLVVLWLAAAWWAYLDISRRTSDQLARLGAMAIVLLSTPALLPLSLLTYVLVRPQTTVAEQRAIQLMGGLHPAIAGQQGCFSCGAAVDPEWRRCPACAEWLASPCDACDEWSELGAEVCPWCAAVKEQDWLPEAVPAAAAASGHAAAAAMPGLSSREPQPAFAGVAPLSAAPAGTSITSEGTPRTPAAGTIDVPEPTHVTLSSGRSVPARAAVRRRRGGAPAPHRLRRSGLGARSEGPLGV
jgi:hypothetical protein